MFDDVNAYVLNVHKEVSCVCVYIYIILFFSIFNNSIVIMMKKWEFRSKIKLSSFKLNFCRLL